jgi:hypothetical protein
MSSEFEVDGMGHPIINPFGQVIVISKNALIALDRRGYLHRDHATGLKGMDPTQYNVYREAEGGSELLKEIGLGCTGPNTCICFCEECCRRLGLLVEDRVEKTVRTR